MPKMLSIRQLTCACWEKITAVESVSEVVVKTSTREATDGVIVHVALGLQPPLLVRHSLISVAKACEDEIKKRVSLLVITIYHTS